MKILHLTNYYPPFYEGSAEIQCQEIIDQLAKNPERRQRVLTSDYMPLNPELHGKDFFRQFDLADRYQSQKEVFRELRLHKMSGHLPSYWSLYRQEKFNVECLSRHLKQFQPDLVLVWGFEALSGAMLFRLENSGIPFAFAILSRWPAKWLKQEPWLRMWEYDGGRYDSVFKHFFTALHLKQRVRSKTPFGDPLRINFENCYICSLSLKNNLRKEGFGVDRAEIIPCGVPVKKFYHKEASPQQLRHLLYLGRLNKDKDPLTAIQALQILHQKGHREFTLDLHGRGDPAYENRLHDYIRRHHLLGAVGFKETNEEQQHVTLYSYDMLLSTSQWAEPFPLMQLKAMAAGLPVISTLEGGHAELIRDRENALAFRTSDPNDLAAKILELSGNPDLVRKITSTAYDEVVKKYGIETVAAQVGGFIERAALRVA